MEDPKGRAQAVSITEAAHRLGIGLVRDGRYELEGRCPRCHGAIHVRPEKGRAGLFFCHEAEEGGDPIDLVRHVLGVGFLEAVKWIG